MPSRRLALLALVLLSLTFAGCKSIPAAKKAGQPAPARSSFVGTWVAVSAHHELEEEIYSASMILDTDGYAFARISEKDYAKQSNDKKIEVEGSTFAIEGLWEQMSEQRVRIKFTATDDDETIAIYCVGWRTGPNAMEVTIMSPEDAFEAYTVQVQRVVDARSKD